MAGDEDFLEVGTRCTNWGRWGADDQLGTLNLIDRQSILRAVSCVRDGTVFDLGLELSDDGPQTGQYKRRNPLHFMSYLPGDFETPHGVGFTDDYVVTPLQAATQWDALAHCCYGGRFYNDRPLDIVSTYAGAKELSIVNARRGVVGRCVLLDIAHAHGTDRLEAGFAIGADMLEDTARRQGVEILPGDILLIRTGWLAVLRSGDRDGFLAAEPGLDLSACTWLRAHDAAAVASDNWGVEVAPPVRPGDIMPVHCVLLRDVGMLLGEMFDLEALAEACRADNRWEGLLSGPVLKVVGGVGSPVNPLVLR